MNAELRTLLDHSRYHQGAVREVAEHLPSTDDALNALVAELISLGDQLGFLLTVTAALDAGRRLDAQHLERGTPLCPEVLRLGNFAWKMDGDVAAALTAAVKRGGIPHEIHVAALFVVAVWCAEKRAGQLPADYLAEARHFVRLKNLRPACRALLAGVARRVQDEGFTAVLAGQYPEVLKPQMAGLTENLIRTHLETFALPAIDLVPEAPSKVLAHRRPMQRAVEKLGRNDLCHCDSGKKYKRCCFEKDQERLHLSSEVAGRTQAELRAAPEVALTESRIKAMPPFELALIDPRKVPEPLLVCYIMQLTGCLLLERAVECFEVLEWNEKSLSGWDFVIFFVMMKQEQALAVRMLAARARHAPDAEEVRAGVRLLIARDDPVAELRVLADTADEIFRERDPELLCRLAYGVLCSRHAALGILIARGIIPLLPPKEAGVLLERILTARDQLNLPPDDPFIDLVEKRLADETSDEGADAAALRTARQRLEAKAAEVRRLHEEIEAQRRALERQEKKREAAPAPQPASDEAERRDLRQKLTYLKGRLQERSAERANLRRDLEKAQGDLETLRRGQSASVPANEAAAGEEEAAHYLPEQPAGNQPVRLIEFPHKFRETLEDLPRQAARSALAMIGRLAGGEPAAFVGVVQLRDCPTTLRQRIGSEHRLLFRLHPDRVQVIDLINRRDFDRKIKSLRAAG